MINHKCEVFKASKGCLLLVPFKYAATSQGVQAGSAGKHWYAERVAAVGLLALIPSGFIYPNPVVDYGLAVLIPLHGHW